MEVFGIYHIPNERVKEKIDESLKAWAIAPPKSVVVNEVGMKPASKAAAKMYAEARIRRGTDSSKRAFFFLLGNFDFAIAKGYFTRSVQEVEGSVDTLHSSAMLLPFDKKEMVRYEEVQETVYLLPSQVVATVRKCAAGGRRSDENVSLRLSIYGKRDAIERKKAGLDITVQALKPIIQYVPAQDMRAKLAVLGMSCT
mmetsp:Transcript_31922/g.83336  ORF Transcript_31922/g.83336 Transcript_31922/m.83336 type:complete len:198 (-) Transcript_31922:414-1007(-)